MKKPIAFLQALTLSLSLMAQPSSSIPGDYALFFAVEQYGKEPAKRPPYAIQDARSIAGLLAAAYGVQVEVVENPTTQEIEDKLAAYRTQFAGGQLPKSGQLLIYFIGEGAPGGEGGSFLPADAIPGQPDSSAHSWGHWLKDISRLDCREVLVVADAEYSSTIEQDWVLNGRIAPRYSPGKEEDWRYATNRSWMMLALDGRKFKGGSGQSLSSYFLQAAARMAERQIEFRMEEILQALGLPDWASLTFFSYSSGNFREGFAFSPRKAPPASGPPENEALWRLVDKQNTLEALSFYCQIYPEGLHTREALSRMDTFSDSWVTADGRAWRAEPLPPKGKDGFLLSGGKATLPWTQRGTAGQGSEPVPTLVIRNFYLSPQEVTNGDFSQFCIETRRVRPGGINWSQRDHPVANISWYDAVEYCNWLSEKQGLKAVYKIKRDNKDPNNFNRLDSLNWAVTADWWANGYRLPTVTEWEYAFSQRGHLNSYGGFGLYNMGQKVQEWCWNWDYPDAYRIAIKNRDPHGPEAGAFRSLRGGGIDGILHRQPDDGATSETPSRKRNNAGFRLVRNGW